MMDDDVGADFKRLREELDKYPPSDPSKRRPTVNTKYIAADNIERNLQENGHRTWGFVFYRCTYESDSDWDAFLKRMRFEVKYSLSLDEGVDMMDSLGFTVLEDPEFDKASVSTIRQHFREWSTTAPQHEQGTGPGSSPRYQFCTMVDKESLDSVVHKAPPPERPDYERQYFVNLIDKSWEPYDPMDEEGELLEDEQEPLEGCTLEQVGWMKVRFQAVMVCVYCRLTDWDTWDILYRRPTTVADCM
jgi:hypothetical protein